MLELIVRDPESPARRPVLLFVHGFWHAAWCWDEFFMPFFACNGFACRALSLRGHGGSPSRERLRWVSMRDYVDDLAEIASRLPEPPVLVGHSGGGFVVQKYLEEHDAAGAVLLASMPPTGALPTVLNVAKHHPGAFMRAVGSLSLAPIVATTELARAQFFSASMPEEQVRDYQRRLQDDSFRAFLDLIALDLVRVQRVRRAPMLVLGAAGDALLSPRRVRRTAETYIAEVHVFPGMAHDMMLDAEWQAVAERVLTWLDREFPARAS